MTPLQAIQAAGMYYVIIKDAVSQWRKGDVVAGGILVGAGADVIRLMNHGAIRPASDAEASLRHVDIPSAEKNLSYQDILAEKDKVIAVMTARISALEEQVAAGASVRPVSPASPMPQQDALIRQKDKALSDMKVVLGEKDKLIAELESKVRELRETIAGWIRQEQEAAAAVEAAEIAAQVAATKRSAEAKAAEYKDAKAAEAKAAEARAAAVSEEEAGIDDSDLDAEGDAPPAQTPASRPTPAPLQAPHGKPKGK